MVPWRLRPKDTSTRRDMETTPQNLWEHGSDCLYGDTETVALYIYVL